MTSLVPLQGRLILPPAEKEQLRREQMIGFEHLARRNTLEARQVRSTTVLSRVDDTAVADPLGYTMVMGR